MKEKRREEEGIWRSSRDEGKIERGLNLKRESAWWAVRFGSTWSGYLQNRHFFCIGYGLFWESRLVFSNRKRRKRVSLTNSELGRLSKFLFSSSFHSPISVSGWDYLPFLELCEEFGGVFVVGLISPEVAEIGSAPFKRDRWQRHRAVTTPRVHLLLFWTWVALLPEICTKSQLIFFSTKL